MLVDKDITDKDITDPDPIGKNLVAANKMFAVFYIRRYSSYQDGTAAGLAAHQRFIILLKLFMDCGIFKFL